MERSHFLPRMFFSFTLVLVLLLYGVPGLAASQPPSLPERTEASGGHEKSTYLTQVGVWPYGPAYAVDVDVPRELIYLGSGGAVLVLDGSDPANPLLLCDEIRTFGLVKDLFYESGTQRLYLACGEGGLEIWDLADPLAPARLSVTEVLYFDVETPVDNVDVYSHFAIVECSWGYVHSLDVSDPTDPVQMGGNGMMGNPAHDLHVSPADGQAHTTGAQNYTRLSIAPDGGLPSSGYKDFTYGPYAVFGTAEVAYVGYGGALYLVDLLQGGSLWSYIDLDGVTDLVVEGGNAFVVNNDGLHIVDVQDYSAPSLVSSLPLALYPDRIAIAGDRAYVVSGSAGLSIVDVSDTSAPSLLGGYEVPSVPWETVVAGDYAYMAHAYEGLMVLDISDLDSVELVGQLDTPGEARDMSLRGNLLYLADWTGGLRIIDVSTPTAPVELGSHEAFAAWRVWVEGNIAYVVEVIVNESGWVHVLDVADPAQIVELGALEIGSLPWEIVLYGDHLYVGEYGDPLRILDVSDPAAPFQAGTVPVTDVFAMRERDGVLYLTSGAVVNGGFGILSLDDPLHPTLIGRYGDFWFSPFNLDVAGDFAYVGLLHDDLALFSIADPQNPILVDEIRLPASIHQIFARGKHVFVSNGGAGLHVVENLLYGPSAVAEETVPDGRFLDQNHPNPFNPRTTIAFDLQESGRVILRVYDVAGRLVKTLVDQDLAEGRHTARWNGTDSAGRSVASGSYYYELRAGEFRQTRKMSLVR